MLTSIIYQGLQQEPMGYAVGSTIKFFREGCNILFFPRAAQQFGRNALSPTHRYFTCEALSGRGFLALKCEYYNCERSYEGSRTKILLFAPVNISRHAYGITNVGSTDKRVYFEGVNVLQMYREHYIHTFNIACLQKGKGSVLFHENLSNSPLAKVNTLEVYTLYGTASDCILLLYNYTIQLTYFSWNMQTHKSWNMTTCNVLELLPLVYRSVDENDKRLMINVNVSYSTVDDHEDELGQTSDIYDHVNMRQ